MASSYNYYTQRLVQVNIFDFGLSYIICKRAELLFGRSLPIALHTSSNLVHCLEQHVPPATGVDAAAVVVGIIIVLVAPGVHLN